MTTTKNKDPLTQDEIDQLRVFLGNFNYSPLNNNSSNPSKDWIKSNTFSNRQIEVFFRISKGKTDQEICSSLDIAKTTLKRDIKNVFEKLEAYSRGHAIGELFRLGILK